MNGLPGPPRGRPRIPRVKSRPLPPAWTGITAPDCHLCTWSWLNGIRQVKFRSEACTVHPAPASSGSEGGEGQ